jgi:hypothetical protein
MPEPVRVATPPGANLTNPGTSASAATLGAMSTNEEVQRRAAVRVGVGLEVVTITWMVVEAAIAAAARREDLPQRDMPRALSRPALDARLTDR